MDPRVLFSLSKTVRCTILGRLNRFVVRVRVGKREADAHINNTGRLHDLVVPGAGGFCIPGEWPRTRYRLFAIGSHREAALIDTRLQMLAFERALQLGLIPWARGLSIERRSPRFGSSVFDYLLSNSGGAVVEVKSAALRIGRCASYPDCPSERAKRQLSDLATLPQRRKIIVFIAAVPGVRAFRLNWSADPELCAVIERIARRGVELRSIHVVYSEPRVLLLDPDLVVRLEVPRR